MAVNPIFNTPMATAQAYAQANSAATTALFAPVASSASASGIPGAVDSVQWSDTALEAANFLALASTLDTMRVGAVATEALVARNLQNGQAPGAAPDSGTSGASQTPMA